jgi:hypothetical protein
MSRWQFTLVRKISKASFALFWPFCHFDFFVSEASEGRVPLIMKLSKGVLPLAQGIWGNSSADPHWWGEVLWGIQASYLPFPRTYHPKS